MRFQKELIGLKLDFRYITVRKVYAAEVKNEVTGTHHIDINSDILFPISQGNL